MIESYGFVEMYLVAGLSWWQAIGSSLAVAISEVAVLVVGCA